MIESFEEKATDARLSQYLALHDLGFSLILSRADDPKRPGHKWKGNQTERFTKSDLFSLYRSCPDEDREPGQNMFLLTGAHPWDDSAGVIVIEGDDFDAVAMIVECCPETPLCVYSGRGTHYYYKHPGYRVQQQLGHTINGVEYKIDRKADGNYVVAPGSYHKDGKVYTPNQPITREILDSLPVFDPAWLPHQGAKKRTVSDAPNVEDYECDWDSQSHEEALCRCTVPLAGRIERCLAYVKATPGTKQGDGASNACFRLAMGVVWGFLLPAAEAVKVLAAWGQQEDQVDEVGSPYPWTLSEIEHKVQAVLNKIPEKPPGWLLNRTQEPGPRDSFFDQIEAEMGSMSPKAGPVEDQPTPPPADDQKETIATFLGRLKAKGVSVESIVTEKSKVLYGVKDCPCCEDPGVFVLDMISMKREYTCSGMKAASWSEATRMFKAASLVDSEEFQMRSPVKLLSKTLATPRLPFVENIAYFGTSTLLAAAPTAGKSALVRALIASNVKGEKFLGRFRSRRACHLYYDGEGGQDTLYSLLELMGSKFADDMPDPFETEWTVYKDRCQDRGRQVVAEAERDGNLKLLEEYVRIRSFVPGGLNPEVIRRDVEKLRQQVGVEIPIVVYVDTFRTWHGSRPDYEENSNSFLASIVADYSKLAKSINVSLWMLHHTKKDGQGVAGGTFMEGGNDGIILYKKDGEEFDAARILEVRRMSRGDTSSLAPIGVNRDPLTGDLIAFGDPKQLKRMKYMGNLAVAYKGDLDAKLTRKVLKSKLVVTNFDEFILDCDTLGLLKHQEGKGKGSPYEYYLTTTAKADLIDQENLAGVGADAGFFQ